MLKAEFVRLRNERFGLAKEYDSLLAAIESLGKGKVSLSISIKPEKGEAHEIECGRGTASEMASKFLLPRLTTISERIDVISERLDKSGKLRIPLWTECKKEREQFRLNGVYAIENCVFCNNPTTTWHRETNNPICLKCGDLYYVSEIPEDFGENIRKQIKEGTFDGGTSVRAN